MIPNLNTENANLHVKNTKHIFTLAEKCPNTEFFVVRIQENTDEKNSVFVHFSRSVNKNENGRTRPDISLKHEGRLGFQGFNRFTVVRVVNIKLGLPD